MTNNKQSMKLYTEYEIRKLLKEQIIFDNDDFDKLTPIELPSDMLCVNCDESKPTHNICMDCIIKVGKQNIELPSDEEIEKIAFRRVNGLTDYLTPKELNCLKEGYMNGMKLLINKIQGGNNEQ